MHFTDRSRIETRLKCGRKFYWNYLFGGRGVVPATDKPELAFGLSVHDAMEYVATGNEDALVQSEYHLDYLQKIDEVTPDGYLVGEEYESLRYGLTETFKRFTLPRILEDYEWVGSEIEITLPLASEISLMTRLDGHLRRRSDGVNFVLEAKTTTMPEELAKQASKNFQLLLEIEALRHHLKGEPVGGAILLTYNKGRKQPASKRDQDEGRDGFRLLSPFTYWNGRELADGTREYRLEYTRGWDRIPTWEIPNWYEIALANWPDEVKSQVQLWPSIEADPARTASVIRQVVSQEELVKIFKGYTPNNAPLVDTFFPQNFGNCENDGGFRKPCPYAACCFSPNVGRDPIGSELYTERLFNHPQEESK
jgi:hypothetical protein